MEIKYLTLFPRPLGNFTVKMKIYEIITVKNKGAPFLKPREGCPSKSAISNQIIRGICQYTEYTV